MVKYSLTTRKKEEKHDCVKSFRINLTVVHLFYTRLTDVFYNLILLQGRPRYARKFSARASAKNVFAFRWFGIFVPFMSLVVFLVVLWRKMKSWDWWAIMLVLNITTQQSIQKVAIFQRAFLHDLCSCISTPPVCLNIFEYISWGYVDKFFVLICDA